MPHLRQVIILAAGQGTRLRPATGALPKCLVKIGNKSFLERNLDNAAHYRDLSVCIVTGFQKSKIQSCVDGYAGRLNVHLCTNPLYDKTNNAYSLWTALQEHPGPFVLLDGDLLYDPRLLERLLKDPREDLVVVETDRSRLNAEAMKVECGVRPDVVTAISKSISMERAAGESIGMGKFSTAWATLIFASLANKMPQQSCHQIYYEDVIAPLLKKAPPLAMLPTAGLAWEEVDTPDDLAHATQLWSQQTIFSAK